MIAGTTRGEVLLRLSSVSKTFGGQRALAGVDFEVREGEVVGLVGQNGCGKSTLAKILARYHQPDPGATMEVLRDDGAMVDIASVERSLHFIHQDLGLVPTLSALENIGLEQRQGRRLLLPVQRRRERSRALEVMSRFGARIDVNCPVADLTSAERTIVAMARALDQWATTRNVLVVDEATATLYDDEVRQVHGAIRQVARSGAGVIYISHRLDEIFELCDRVVVLRDGKVVANEATVALDHDRLVELMTGRALESLDDRHNIASGDVVLSATGVGGARVRQLDLQVRRGEIVGVAGVLGSGREQLGALLSGAQRRHAGTVSVADRVVGNSPRASIAAGLAYVPPDRSVSGMCATMSVRENMTLVDLQGLIARPYRLSRARERQEAAAWIDRLQARPAEPDRTIGTLSGGNQQKIIMAKWLRTAPKALVIDEPTQGVDAAAKVAIYGLLRQAADHGTGILVTSSDAKELSLISDRVLVLHQGRVAREIDGAQLSEERIVHEVMSLRSVATGDDDNV